MPYFVFVSLAATNALRPASAARDVTWCLCSKSRVCDTAELTPCPIFSVTPCLRLASLAAANTFCPACATCEPKEDSWPDVVGFTDPALPLENGLPCVCSSEGGLP